MSSPATSYHLTLSCRLHSSGTNNERLRGQWIEGLGLKAYSFGACRFKKMDVWCKPFHGKI